MAVGSLSFSFSFLLYYSSCANIHLHATRYRLCQSQSKKHAMNLCKLSRESVEAEEEASIALMKHLDDRETKVAFSVLLQLKCHRRIEHIIGADSREAIASYFHLAQSYNALGNHALALECSLRGLSYGEVLFGAFSEENVMGLVTVGEVMENAKFNLSNKLQAIEFYKRALVSVDRLYRMHPLKGKLCCKLHFLINEMYPDQKDTSYLQQGYEAYCQMFGSEGAQLIIPLLALENNVPEFVLSIQGTTTAESDLSGHDLLQLSSSFWPSRVLKTVQMSKSRKDILEVIEKFKQRTAYELLFEDCGERKNFDLLLQLSDSELQQINLKRGIFEKIRKYREKAHALKSKSTLRLSNSGGQTSDSTTNDIQEHIPAMFRSKSELWRIYHCPPKEFIESLTTQVLKANAPKESVDIVVSEISDATFSVHYERLCKRLEMLSLKETSIINRMDHHTQFSALSSQLFATALKTDELRKKAVEWLSTHFNWEMSDGTVISGLVGSLTWEEYCNRMLSPDCYGDGLTLLAIAEKYDVSIVVVSSKESERWITEISPKRGKYGKTIILSLCDDLFYGVLSTIKSKSSTGSDNINGAVSEAINPSQPVSQQPSSQVKLEQDSKQSSTTLSAGVTTTSSSKEQPMEQGKELGIRFSMPNKNESCMTTVSGSSEEKDKTNESPIYKDDADSESSEEEKPSPKVKSSPMIRELSATPPESEEESEEMDSNEDSEKEASEGEDSYRDDSKKASVFPKKAQNPVETPMSQMPWMSVSLERGLSSTGGLQSLGQRSSISNSGNEIRHSSGASGLQRANNKEQDNFRRGGSGSIRGRRGGSVTNST